MHLVLYGRTLLDLYGVSTPVTIALLAGAGYGAIRLFIDTVGAIGLGPGAGRRSRAPREPDTAELVAAVRRALDAEQRDEG